MVGEFVEAEPPVVSTVGGGGGAELKGRDGVFRGEEESRSGERGGGK